jgi:hypothetical protein
MSNPTLAQKVFSAAHLTGRFKLRSGATSGEYFDKQVKTKEPPIFTPRRGSAEPDEPGRKLQRNGQRLIRKTIQITPRPRVSACAHQAVVWFACNEFMVKRGIRDTDNPGQVEGYKTKNGFGGRTDIETYFDVIEADEGRLN